MTLRAIQDYCMKENVPLLVLQPISEQNRLRVQSWEENRILPDIWPLDMSVFTWAGPVGKGKSLLLDMNITKQTVVCLFRNRLWYRNQPFGAGRESPSVICLVEAKSRGCAIKYNSKNK